MVFFVSFYGEHRHLGKQHDTIVWQSYEALFKMGCNIDAAISGTSILDGCPVTILGRDDASEAICFAVDLSEHAQHVCLHGCHRRKRYTSKEKRKS